jgi:hypothetical protein
MGSMSCSKIFWVERGRLKIQPIPVFQPGFFTTKQHDTQTIASKPSQLTQYTHHMILDAWEGNLCALCLAACWFVWNGRLKIQLSQSQFSARFVMTKQHDTQTTALKPSQFTQYTQHMNLDAWEGKLTHYDTLSFDHLSSPCLVFFHFENSYPCLVLSCPMKNANSLIFSFFPFF